MQGMILPSRTWCFVAEIVSDALSQESVLGHRVEVRDLAGDIRSILFYPDENASYFDWQQLKAGSTIFIRYAQRCFFSDLATEAIKCEDPAFVKVIPASIDTLLWISQSFGSQTCQACNGSLSNLGGSVTKCESCHVASYCSQQCCISHMPSHRSYCLLCHELSSVLNIDFDRFASYVPFR